MKIFIILGVIMWGLANYVKGNADTLDIWTAKVNDKVIINSNEAEIFEGGHPMMINLSEYSDTDTLKLCFWNDTGREQRLWHLKLKDVNNKTIKTFSNPIDSNIKCFPEPCKEYRVRKNYILFKIKYLKKLMQEKNIKEIYVEFDFNGDTNSIIESRNKNVAIISIK